MKILLINSVYKEGSTGKIVDAIATTLRAQGHDVLTCYGLGSDYYDDYSEKVCSPTEHKLNALWSRISGIPFGGLYLSNKRIEKIIETYKPDVVHVHCVNASTMNVYQLFRYLGDQRVKTVLTLHAEIFHTGGCDHAYECEKWKAGCHDCDVYKEKVGSWFFDRSKTSYQLMREAMSHFRPENLIVTAVSPWLVNRAKLSAILKGFRIEYVPNGVDTSVFHFISSKGLIKRDGFDSVVLHVTPCFTYDKTDIKGGRFIPIIANEMPRTLFIVVSTKTKISQEQLPANVLLWGRAKTQTELAQLYSEADVTLILSKRETFSMVTAESLCCGTPVVGFKAGGPESIALPDFSKFVEYGNINELLIALSFFYSKLNNNNIAPDEYSKEVMTQGYYNLYVN